MQTVTVKKADLIEKMIQNRDDHRDQFLAAQVKYREKVIEELDRRLASVRDGKQFDLAFRLPEPVDYTSEYNTVLSMLNWEVADEVELEHHDFERYVLNKWEWARNFAASTQSYLA